MMKATPGLKRIAMMHDSYPFPRIRKSASNFHLQPGELSRYSAGLRAGLSEF
jgi:hypothetical protein